MSLEEEDVVNLERVEEEGEEDFDVAQEPRCLFVRGEDKDNLMDPEQRDKGQRGLRQSVERKNISHSQESRRLFTTYTYTYTNRHTYRYT